MFQLLAILEVKGIVTSEEAERLADNFANAPQPSRYNEALQVVRKLTDKPKK